MDGSRAASERPLTSENRATEEPRTTEEPPVTEEPPATEELPTTEEPLTTEEPPATPHRPAIFESSEHPDIPATPVPAEPSLGVSVDDDRDSDILDTIVVKVDRAPPKILARYIEPVAGDSHPYALRSRTVRAGAYATHIVPDSESDGNNTVSDDIIEIEPPAPTTTSTPQRTGKGKEASRKRARSPPSTSSWSKKKRMEDIDVTPSSSSHRTIKMQFRGWNPDPEAVPMSVELQNVFSLHVSQSPQPDLVLDCCMSCVSRW